MILNKIFIENLYEKMPNEKVKAIIDKIHNNKITWQDISKIEKLGIKIPEEIENMGDNNIAFDKDNIPITDKDIELGKIKEIENTAKLDMNNYLWLNEIMPENMNISEKVNSIIELYKEIYLNTQKAMDFRISKTKNKTIA